ncbi:MAG: hypothetical protein ACRDRZ_15595 [Pseudonocardiaceae bacterium]
MSRRLLCTGVVLGALLAGCGGGEAPPPGSVAAPSGSDPVQWADAYCSGIGGALQAALRLADPLLRADAAAQKQALAGYLGAAQAAYTDAARRVEQLGPPAVPDAERRQQAVLEFLRGSARAAEDQARQLAALDPAAPDFQQRFAAIEQSGFDVAPLQRELQDLRSDPELSRALSEARSCRAIGQGLGGQGLGGR